MAYDPRSPGNPWLPYPAGEPPYARGQGTELEGLPGVGFIPQSTPTRTDTQPSSSFVEVARNATQKKEVNRRSYPEPPFWVTEITYDDGSKEWKKEDLEQAIKAGATDTWRVKEEKEVADAAAAEAAKAAEEAAIAKAKAERLAAEQQAEKERLEREANENKPENRPAIVPIPHSQSLDPNKPGGVATGPISNAVEGQYFGDKEKYGIKLGKGGVAPGGGNPNEMYRWYMEAKAAGYENYEDLWNLNPEQAIGAYNQWKIREQAKGRKFIGVNDYGSGEGGRIIPVDAQANYQAEVASVEQAALAAQAAASAAQTPSTGGTGWTDISRDLVDAGFYPDMSVHEALQGAGMYGGNPFLRSVQAELGRSLSPFKLAQGVSQLQGQTPPTYGDFLQGRLGGERGLGAYGTPEILGNIVNPPSGGWELLASQLEDPRFGFDIAAHASGLGAPSFLRNELYNQQSRLQNQFQSQLSQGQIKDTLGADYFDYLRRQLGAA